jgi:hypothetical protein
VVSSAPDYVTTQQPRPRTCYKVYIVFLIHTTKGWFENINVYGSHTSLDLAIT